VSHCEVTRKEVRLRYSCPVELYQPQRQFQSVSFVQGPIALVLRRRARFCGLQGSADINPFVRRHQNVKPGGFGGVKKIAILQRGPATFPRLGDGVVQKCFRKATRDIIIEQNQHSLEAVRIETVCREIEDSFNFLAGNGILLNDFVNGHSVLKVFKNELYRSSRIAKRPCTTHLAGDAFHGRALGPVEICCHVITLFSS